MAAGAEADRRAIVADLLVGRRGIVKAIHVWWPTLLYVSASGRPPDPLVVLVAFVAAVCWGQAAILGNDLADRTGDAGAGKRRWIAALPGRAGRTVVGLFAVGGLGALAAAGAGAAAWATYVAAIALGLAYSLPPLRLKERGAWGPAAYSASACLAYAALPAAWLSAPAGLATAAAAAVFLDKWVNLHFHQVLDLDADRAAGVRTFAVAVGVKRARASLRAAACAASAVMLAGVVVSCIVAGAWAWAVAVGAGVLAGAVALYAARARRRAEVGPLLREVPWHYLALTLALFRAVPAVLLVRACLLDARLCAVAALFGVLLLIEARHLVGYRHG